MTALYQQAAEAEVNGQLLNAMELWTELFAKTPTPGMYAAAHQSLGTTELKLNHVLDAEYHLRRAVELEPLDMWSHLYLANLLAVQGQESAAEAEYRAAIAVGPDHAAGIEFFARFLEGVKREEEALAVRSSPSGGFTFLGDLQ